MSNVDKKRSWFALVTGHMAGMIDLVALPVWVGTLIAGYSLLPSQAGGLATLFLIGVVACNLALSARFHKMNGRWLAPLGFGASAVIFLVMTQTTDFAALAVLHVLGGAATGVGISLTHGSMGRSSSPHRVFALAGLGLGIIGVVYLGVTPQLIAQFGPSMLFWVFAAVMGFAAVVHTLFFPSIEPAAVHQDKAGRLSVKVWFVIIGVACMALNNSMALSFAERKGVDSGFGVDMVTMALIVMGLVAILPAILAAILEKKFSVLWVAPIGALLHGGCALFMLSAGTFPAFMGPLIFMPFLMIFTHVFLFGHLARLDPTGRAVAATPAMVMTGSAVGPFLGGMILETFGYPQIGMATFVLAVIAAAAFLRSNTMADSAASLKTA